ncbi:hypothetical protein BC830DRAFT_1162925 [Chytriomyces sp. MP71]|nr:hypothetical protein BC830DRAFT_1162925 [Chytriomyces sp. MP71]
MAALILFSALVLQARGSCTPTQNSCQIQSDPFVQPFSGATYSVERKGTYFALDSEEMQVQVTIVSKYSQNLGKEVLVVEELSYACTGGERSRITTEELRERGPMTMSCAMGSCARGTCRVSILPGSDPVPNIQIQQIQYFGTMGKGGLCFQNDRQCQGLIYGGGEGIGEGGRPVIIPRPTPNGKEGGIRRTPTPVRPRPIYTPPIIIVPTPIRPRPIYTPRVEPPCCSTCGECGGSGTTLIIEEILVVPEVIEILPRVCSSIGISSTLGRPWFQGVLMSSSYNGFYRSYCRAASLRVSSPESQMQVADLITRMTAAIDGAAGPMSPETARTAVSGLAQESDLTPLHVATVAAGVAESLLTTAKDDATGPRYDGFMALSKASGAVEIASENGTATATTNVVVSSGAQNRLSHLKANQSYFYGAFFLGNWLLFLI